MKGLQRGPHIVVGTPGRVFDLMGRNCLKADRLKCICLDEADEMLDRGFKDTMYDIFQFLPRSVQVCLFSATMPDECLSLTEQFMRDPIHILVKRPDLTLDGISQYYVDTCQERFKFPTLVDLYKACNVQQAVIFCNTKQKVESVADRMNADDFVVSCIHGDMEQIERDLRMKEFRSGSSRVLISTDIIARGIDVQNVSLVINYDVPNNFETYLHRIGRSGRCGRKGVAINFVNGDDNRAVRQFRALEKYYETMIEELPCDVSAIM